MTRHGKNATASSVYSYSERRKDASQSGYGTLHERLSADSIKPFDCCSLSLQPCREPLISPDGFIFDKESILNYILDQKKAYKRKLKIWEEQTRIDQEKEATKMNKKEEESKHKFLSIESLSTPAHLKVPETPSASERAVKRYNAGDDNDAPTSSKKKATNETSVSNMAGDKARKWNNFWVPELIPTAEPTKIEKPSDKIMCPITEKPLKYKDLMQVKFTPIDNDHNGDHAKLVGKKYRYMCPITRDVLTNTSRCAYLKTS
ncbi:zinc-finger of nitric oxide synthase-interacting protein [Ditylenchus destructor]|nr:zinc-finger of nitric oxide synthase-interacting protein [Ditylenchus destructor]